MCVLANINLLRLSILLFQLSFKYVSSSKFILYTGLKKNLFRSCKCSQLIFLFWQASLLMSLHRLIFYKDCGYLLLHQSFGQSPSTSLIHSHNPMYPIIKIISIKRIITCIQILVAFHKKISANS